MANDRRIKKEFHIGESRYHDVSIWFTDPTYISGDQKGYYLYINPFEREGNWKTSTAYSGYKHLLVPAKRFSAKKLGKLFNIVEPHMELLSKVWEHEDLTATKGIIAQIDKEIKDKL